ncbi:dihydrofolate reductase family protein [Nonomuraea sp. NPDC050643]|uniref:dihydrofolate reductase family protein n=1 Tax=Nonomuraea sp. NPDC050643 TaxID=3155660 RepID=UPI0033DCBEC8
MRKLIESTFVTMDGVISDPHVWGPPYWDEEHNAYSAKLLFDADALLLGRETYEGFAEAWPSRSGDPYTDRINSLPKHVASTTLKEADAWNGSLIQGDVAEAVAELKRRPGQSILKFGTGSLDRTLIEHGLVDEFHFWVFPVIAGGGDRLLDGLDVTHLELLETTRFTSGIVVHTYGPKA